MLGERRWVEIGGIMSLVKSRQRVADHGEVFTPKWMVEDMLDLVKAESERIDSRFLEPACGSGNFLVEVLKRKLQTVEAKYGKNRFEKEQYSLLSLMCIYGIELLEDNSIECRENLMVVFSGRLAIGPQDSLYLAARNVLEANVIQGNALNMTTPGGEHLIFPEWAYLSKGRFQRRDFRFDSLAQRSVVKGNPFEQFEEYEIFTPIKTYPPMTIEELSK
jgi:hypothetical protein